MEIEKIYSDYDTYFTTLMPEWKVKPYDLILKLVNLNDIDSIKFLIENADEIFSLKTQYVYRAMIRYWFSNAIGRLNRVDLLNSGIKLNYKSLAEGAIEGKNYNMFLYGFDKIKNELSKEEISDIIELSAAEQNLSVLKFLLDTYTDEFRKMKKSIISMSILHNLTDTLSFLIEQGIATLDELKDMLDKKRFEGRENKNLMNFIQSYTILGKRKTREEHMEIIPKRQRIV